MPKRYVNYNDPEVSYKRSINAALAREKGSKKKDETKKKTIKPKRIGQTHERWKGDKKKKYTQEQLDNLEKANGIKQIYDILEANRINRVKEEEFEAKKNIISTI